MVLKSPLPSWERFEEWLQLLLWEKKVPLGESEVPERSDSQSESSPSTATTIATAIDVMRMKGILSISNEPNKLILQGVREVYDKNAVGLWTPDETRESCIVFIGRNLRSLEIQHSLEKFLWST